MERPLQIPPQSLKLAQQRHTSLYTSLSLGLVSHMTGREEGKNAVLLWQYGLSDARHSQPPWHSSLMLGTMKEFAPQLSGPGDFL